MPDKTALWWEPVDAIPKATRARPRFDAFGRRIVPDPREYPYREGRVWGYSDLLRDFLRSDATFGRVTFDVDRFSPTRIRSGLRVAIADRSLPVSITSRGESIYLMRGGRESQRTLRDVLRSHLLVFAHNEHRTTTITLSEDGDIGYAERCLRNLRRTEGVPFVRIECNPARRQITLRKELLG